MRVINNAICERSQGPPYMSWMNKRKSNPNIDMSTSSAVPLCVDLDGTLIHNAIRVKVQSLIETI